MIEDRALLNAVAGTEWPASEWKGINRGMPDIIRVNGRSKPKFNGARNARDYLTIIQISPLHEER
jgi:hypothetical protein